MVVVVYPSADSPKCEKTQRERERSRRHVPKVTTHTHQAYQSHPLWFATDLAPSIRTHHICLKLSREREMDKKREKEKERERKKKKKDKKR